MDRLEKAIDYGQGNDEAITEIFKSFKAFRDGYYGLLNYGEDWWEVFNQGQAFDETMREAWEEIESMDIMESLEVMAMAMAGSYVNFNRFAEGVISLQEGKEKNG